MSDSQFCYVHWSDSDLANAEHEHELEDIPDDDIKVPLNLQPASIDDNDQAFQQELAKDLKWTDMDLPMSGEPQEQSQDEMA